MVKYIVTPDIKITTVFIFIINCWYWFIFTKGSKKQTWFSMLRCKWFNKFPREIDILMMCQTGTWEYSLPSQILFVSWFLEPFALISPLAVTKIFPKGIFTVFSHAGYIISTLRAGCMYNGWHVIDTWSIYRFVIR